MNPSDTDKLDFGTSSHNIRSKRVELKGAIDMETAPALRQKLKDVIAKKPAVILINLAQVTKMDSAGVAVLVEAIQWARQEKLILSLQEVSEPACQMLQMARVDKLFQVSGNNYLPPTK